MRLLDAVNLTLTKLGEDSVTEIDAQHPTLAIILPLFDTSRRSLLGRGWWFNQSRYTAPLSITGEITLSPDTLSFVADSPGAVLRGNRLFDQLNQTYVFTEPVAGVLTLDIPFEELPESAATFVLYDALIGAYVNDLGVDNTLGHYERLAGAAYSDLIAEHLRHQKYSTRHSRRFRNLKRALRS